MGNPYNVEFFFSLLSLRLFFFFSVYSLEIFPPPQFLLSMSSMRVIETTRHKHPLPISLLCLFPHGDGMMTAYADCGMMYMHGQRRGALCGG